MAPALTRRRSRSISDEDAFRCRMGMHGELMDMNIPVALDHMFKEYCSFSDRDNVSSDDENKSSRSKVFKRSISFEEDVQVVEIPSCSSFSDETKRSMWYTQEEFKHMRTSRK